MTGEGVGGGCLLGFLSAAACALTVRTWTAGSFGATCLDACFGWVILARPLLGSESPVELSWFVDAKVSSILRRGRIGHCDRKLTGVWPFWF